MKCILLFIPELKLSARFIINCSIFVKSKFHRKILIINFDLLILNLQYTEEVYTRRYIFHRTEAE